MLDFSPKLKQHILTLYTPHSRERSFAALARQYGVAGGESTVRRWHRQWDGTERSLQPKPKPGRPRLLSKRQLARHVQLPIKNKNRAHAAVHYPDLLQPVREKTGAQISLRTLQRYGKERLHAKSKHATKRTVDECECAHTHLIV
jgi:transposase